MDLKTLFKGTNLLVVIAFVACVLFLSVVLTSLFSRSQTASRSHYSTANSSPTPTPFTTPTPKISQQLTATEQLYPTAYPQRLYSFEGSESGTLIVTSSLAGVTVTLDEEDPREGSSASANNSVPTQPVPFIYKEIPVGNHLLRPQQHGTSLPTVFLHIKAQKITRVVIN